MQFSNSAFKNYSTNKMILKYAIKGQTTKKYLHKLLAIR